MCSSGQAVFGVVLCGGSSRRFGEGRSKLLEDVGGKQVIERTLAAFRQSSCVTHLGIVYPFQRSEEFLGEARLGPLDFSVPGGETRQASVRNALAELKSRFDPDENSIVLVHDGARCLVSPSLIERVVEGARRQNAVTAALPMVASVKRVSPSGRVIESLNRSELVEVQTPQGFRFDLLWAAHQRFSESTSATDDACLVEAMSEVFIVEGERTNLKITTLSDLSVARSLVSDALPSDRDALPFSSFSSS
ncbi:MAG: 2-C-methyl-D-erythritol 4-phosphate cytidylyltransferase [Bdellovibrionales bacterium]|nr:2-C-methyl-D-erythritol 4-phosphate cytidylyltransferase [Bdellovibrionales bacterium]